MIVKSLLNKYRKKYRRFQALFQDNQRLAIALALFSILPLLFSSVMTGWLIRHHEQVAQWLAITDVWPLAFLTTIAFATSMAAGLTPTTLVALVCGFFMGFASTGYVVGAYILASVAGYGLGRWLDGDRFMVSLQNFPLAEKIAIDISHRPVVMLVLVRLSPALPFCLTNLLLAALQVRLSLYILAGTLGMLPRTLLSIWIGSQSRVLVTLLHNGGSPQEIIWLVSGTVVTLGLAVWVMKQRLNKIDGSY